MMSSKFEEAKEIVEKINTGGRRGLYKGTTKYYALECLYLSDKKQSIDLITEYVSQAKIDEGKLTNGQKINRDGIRGRLGELVRTGMIARRMTVKKNVRKKEVRFWVLEKGKQLYKTAK